MGAGRILHPLVPSEDTRRWYGRGGVALAFD